jgi:phage-related protein
VPPARPRTREVRTSLPSARIARVIVCFSNGELVALHGFIKKTQKTPPQDIDTALRRKKDYQS